MMRMLPPSHEAQSASSLGGEREHVLRTCWGFCEGHPWGKAVWDPLPHEAVERMRPHVLDV